MMYGRKNIKFTYIDDARSNTNQI